MQSARCSHEWGDHTCLGIEFQIVRRCRTSDGDHRWYLFVKVRVAVNREARHWYRGQRVGEASHPGPMRRLRRCEDVRNVFPRLATQLIEADSDDDRPLVRAPELHVRSNTEPRASGVCENGRRRVRREGSVFGFLTLIDSSDEDTPFVVPARPPSRRVASVPEPEDTLQASPDMHLTSSQGAEHTFSMHQSPNPEGRYVAARVGRQLSVDLTHVDSDSALHVEECYGRIGNCSDNPQVVSDSCNTSGQFWIRTSDTIFGRP